MSTESEIKSIENLSEEFLLKNKCKKIYVVCPANRNAGGVDALHQMVFYLNQQNFDAKLVYRKRKYDKCSIEMSDRYKTYVQSFLVEKDIVDSSENVIVLPESYTKDRYKYKKARIFIWWLGINDSLTYNYWKKFFVLATLPIRVVMHWNLYKGNVLPAISSVLNREAYPFKKESASITHLCASYHAYDYVSKRSKNNIFLCIEPISKIFLQQYFAMEKNISIDNRKNVILYNPARNYNEIIEKLSALLPNLSFEPLRGLNQQQLIEKYMTSKLYIDFGAFPGAERIPKEAVLFGCAVITGRLGSSNFYGDVPIPDEYKFDNPKMRMDGISKKIQYVIDNYETVYSDFNEYRKTVLNLERNFIESLKKVFGQNRISGEYEKKPISLSVCYRN